MALRHKYACSTVRVGSWREDKSGSHWVWDPDCKKCAWLRARGLNKSNEAKPDWSPQRVIDELDKIIESGEEIVRTRIDRKLREAAVRYGVYIPCVRFNPDSIYRRFLQLDEEDIPQGERTELEFLKSPAFQLLERVLKRRLVKKYHPDRSVLPNAAYWLDIYLKVFHQIDKRRMKLEYKFFRRGRYCGPQPVRASVKLRLPAPMEA